MQSDASHAFWTASVSRVLSWSGFMRISGILSRQKVNVHVLSITSSIMSENKYIIRMEDVLSQLIYHMERTTLYRYSMKKADKKPVNINDIMYEVPDIIVTLSGYKGDFTSAV